MIMNWLREKAIAIFIVIAISIWAAYLGYSYGVSKTENHYSQIQKKEESEAAIIQDKVDDKAQEAAKTQETKQEEVRVVYKTIYKDVIQYRDRPVAKETLDKDWVSIHNKAALGPSGDVSEASEATKADALETIIGNYEPYYSCLRKLKGLEDLYNQQRDIINGETK